MSRPACRCRPPCPMDRNPSRCERHACAPLPPTHRPERAGGPRLHAPDNRWEAPNAAAETLRCEHTSQPPIRVPVQGSGQASRGTEEGLWDTLGKYNSV